MAICVADTVNLQLSPLRMDYNKVYDLLVSIGGAPEGYRYSFIFAHTADNTICTEWRFIGLLGFGGKYRSETNSVSCYSEDETPERLSLIRKLNAELSKLA